ncbi:MAG: site-specific DNA-methyltransferase [Clostridia bacterium]|nr:site-specific DNA-methyltransferase [Clostridia bacterium]
MANLSKIKREKMIEFLEHLKEINNDDKSILAINEIKSEIQSKKYGLLWEEHDENVDTLMKDNIPIFINQENKSIKLDEGLPYNFILEGDNLQSLYLLEKVYKGKIDCIYIDPPYNTGAKDWKYNNDYVDKTNEYRHSKWLSMMNARLKIAKKLLKDDGVLVCAIDENELGTLLLLIDDIFDQGYVTDPIVIVHNPRGVQGDNFSYVNEYALFVYKKGYKVIESQLVKEEDIDWRDLRDNGGESLRTDAATCFYAINVSKDGEIIDFGPNRTQDMYFHPMRNVDNGDGTISIYPIDVQGVERKWRYNVESVERIKHLLRVKKIGNIYDIELGKNFAPYRTVWTDKKYDANEYGTQLINSMVPDNDFSFPKSVWNTYECLRAVTLNRPNAIILDFFAGSGTTGHATLLLNKETNGNRKFILCTNNDVGEKKEREYKKVYGNIDAGSESWKEYQEKYGIASSVTFPRIKSAILGYKHNKDFKELLYSRNITPTIIKNNTRVVNEINDIYTNNSNEYNELKTLVEDNKVQVYGIMKKGNTIEGIKGNLKYFKCDWTPRKPEDYSLNNALCLHIKEMIELQNFIDLDNRTNILILNKDDYKNYVDGKDLSKVKNIWVNQNIIFNSQELAILKSKGYKYIPKEFFGEELKEVAE